VTARYTSSAPAISVSLDCGPLPVALYVVVNGAGPLKGTRGLYSSWAEAVRQRDRQLETDRARIVTYTHEDQGT